MSRADDPSELGQFIPLHYHYNMLNDAVRMRGFKAAIDFVVRPGSKVLELGGGTGVLSYFAIQKAAKVWCVERNPELVAKARQILSLNPPGDKVEIIEADAFDFLPPERVDVVICEMIHVAMLREKQIPVIASFKERYLTRFGKPLPSFVPEALIQAVQPVEHDFNFDGYYAPHAPVPGSPLHPPENPRIGGPHGLPIACLSRSLARTVCLAWRHQRDTGGRAEWTALHYEKYSCGPAGKANHHRLAQPIFDFSLVASHQRGARRQYPNRFFLRSRSVFIPT
jgi:SAM-dependent methyltransferase